jgi:outer membrane protein OmpA-like peptidoglycan-associated protein
MKAHLNASVFVISRVLAVTAMVAVAACAKSDIDSEYNDGYIATPTVDYVERLDVYSAPHSDSFLNQLAMNYRSYAIYNARTSGYPDVGELFAQKAVAAFSGEVPFPETLDAWDVADDATAYDLTMAYNDMIEQLQNDASETQPELAAELQAKYDCWISAVATGQTATARECQSRFEKTMTALRDCTGGRIVKAKQPDNQMPVSNAGPRRTAALSYYPETGNMSAMRNANRSREGVIIVNNINVPEHLVNPEPVQPLVFNQNIYGGDKTITDSANTNVHTGCDCANRDIVMMQPIDNCDCPDEPEVEEITIYDDNLVTRKEFVDMMMAMRAELAAINARLDKLSGAKDYDETTIIKVQQIPLEPKQHVMEEVFEIHFDFNKAVIKPEYEDVIRKLVGLTQANRNVKISVVGHTDTSGSKSYNYALGGRRAEAVQKMLIERGIPSSQIVAVSAGEEDLKVPTPDGVPNAENRRVRVVKEVTYTEPGGQLVPVADVSVQEYINDCGGAECDM